MRSAPLLVTLTLVVLAVAYTHATVGSDTLETVLGASGVRVLSIGVNVLALLTLLLVGRSSCDRALALVLTLLVACALARRLAVTDAEHAAFAWVAVGAAGAAHLRVPLRRSTLALWALGLVTLRTAVFHAMGFEESFSTLDVGQAFAGLGTVDAVDAQDAVGATGVTWQIFAAGLQLTLRMALPWLLFFAPLLYMVRQTPGATPAVVRHLVADMTILGAARAAVVIAALVAWWRNTWWIGLASTVYAYAICDIVLFVAIAWLLGVFRRSAASALDPRGYSLLESPA